MTPCEKLARRARRRGRAGRRRAWSRPGIVLVAPGCTSSLPIVARAPGSAPRARARRRRGAPRRRAHPRATPSARSRRARACRRTRPRRRPSRRSTSRRRAALRWPPAPGPARCAPRGSSTDRTPSHPVVRQIAESERGEGLAQRHPVAVAQGGLVGLERPADRATAEDAAAEARALLEPEREHGQGPGGPAARRDRLRHLERREHAERPVEASAVERRVEMRAAPDLGERGVARPRLCRRGCPQDRWRPRGRPRASSRRPTRTRAARRDPRPRRFVPAARPISKSVSRRVRRRAARRSGSNRSPVICAAPPSPEYRGWRHRQPGGLPRRCIENGS